MSTVKKIKEVPIHKDKLGAILQVDDWVAYPEHNMLVFGKVLKLNSKMLKVLPLGSNRRSLGKDVYPDRSIRIEASVMTWYMLKNSK
jgi:hypothetical protein